MSHDTNLGFIEIMPYILLKYYDQYLKDKSQDVKPKRFAEALPDILIECYKIISQKKESHDEDCNTELIEINNDLLDEFLEMDSYLNELD